jgi:hypothetical protein
MAAWPSELPQSFEASSYDLSPASNVIETTMDTGPTKVRRRFTAVSKFHSGDMIIDKDDFEDYFLPFFETTISHWADEFDFPEPFTGDTIVVRWVSGKRGPYRVKQHSPTSVVLSFTLEEIP